MIGKEREISGSKESMQTSTQIILDVLTEKRLPYDELINAPLRMQMLIFYSSPP